MLYYILIATYNIRCCNVIYLTYPASPDGDGTNGVFTGAAARNKLSCIRASSD